MVALAFATASALLASAEYVCPVTGQTFLDACYVWHISVHSARDRFSRHQGTGTRYRYIELVQQAQLRQQRFSVHAHLVVHVCRSRTTIFLLRRRKIYVYCDSLLTPLGIRCAVVSRPCIPVALATCENDAIGTIILLILLITLLLQLLSINSNSQLTYFIH